MFKTIGEERVNEVVNALKNGNPDAIEKVLNIQVEKNRRQHLNDFFNEVKTVVLFKLVLCLYYFFFLELQC